MVQPFQPTFLGGALGAAGQQIHLHIHGGASASSGAGPFLGADVGAAAPAQPLSTGASAFSLSTGASAFSGAGSQVAGSQVVASQSRKPPPKPVGVVCTMDKKQNP